MKGGVNDLSGPPPPSVPHPLSSSEGGGGGGGNGSVLVNPPPPQLSSLHHHHTFHTFQSHLQPLHSPQYGYTGGMSPHSNQPIQELPPLANEESE